MNILLRSCAATALLLTVLSPLCAEDLKVPPAAVAGEELTAVRDKLMTGLFFRGELADSIMEAGLQDKFPGTAGLRTRSETRQALMNWIRNDPEKAANLYFYLKDRGPAGRNVPVGADSGPSSWALRRHFLDMAGLASKAAADRTMTDEEISLAAQRLFGSELAAPEDYAPLIPGGAGGAAAPAESGRTQEIKYADYELHAERVDKESQALEAWLNSVKKNLEAERGSAADSGREDAMLERAFASYRNFTVVLSNLKGLARINASDAVRIEKLRREFRLNLAGLEALSALRRIDRLSAGPGESGPGADLLRGQASALKSDFEDFLSLYSGDAADPGRAMRRLYELETRADVWAFKIFLQQRLRAMKSGAGRPASCVLDRLMYGYLARFFPASGYARAEAALSLAAASMDAELAGIAGAGGAELSPAGIKPLLSGMTDLEGWLTALKRYSRLNARLQFIFWDALANPLGLRPGRKGITAGIGW